jgi:hypothetical protein
MRIVVGCLGAEGWWEGVSLAGAGSEDVFWYRDNDDDLLRMVISRMISIYLSS